MATDMNAKVGYAGNWRDKNLDLYGKGYMNNNEKRLLDLARLNSLVILYTLFYHKMSRRATLTQP